METRISVVIPNRNGGASLEKCLCAVFASEYKEFEVILADDCSTDNSVEIAERFPCKITRLQSHRGAGAARNAGAKAAVGKILFFIDADCVVNSDTLSIVERTVRGRQGTVFGGTYTTVPFDDNFFGTFQSVFIHYSETKNSVPDYIATHAMVIERNLFERTGGFREDFLPILEDVEFSHRLRSSGIKLNMNPEIAVRHVFNFTLSRSLKNAFRKTLYWTMYSVRNKDLFTDSGTASLELKVNVLSFFSSAGLLLACAVLQKVILLPLVLLICGLNFLLNRRFISLLYKTKGGAFAMLAAAYYGFVYPLPIGVGSVSGLVKHFFRSKERGP